MKVRISQSVFSESVGMLNVLVLIGNSQQIISDICMFVFTARGKVSYYFYFSLMCVYMYVCFLLMKINVSKCGNVELELSLRSLHQSQQKTIVAISVYF